MDAGSEGRVGCGRSHGIKPVWVRPSGGITICRGEEAADFVTRRECMTEAIDIFSGNPREEMQRRIVAEHLFHKACPGRLE